MTISATEFAIDVAGITKRFGDRAVVKVGGCLGDLIDFTRSLTL